VAVGLLIIGGAGYVGFAAFARSNGASGSALLLLAAATGFAAFFSPCSFPLLLTFLTRRADESATAAAVSALRVGAGAASLLLALAATIAITGDAVATVVAFDRPAGRILRLTIGLMLVVFGLHQARLIRVRMRWLDWVAGRGASAFDPSQRSNRASADFVYGFGYLLAGFG
jgi:cytochrome c biogenesis protein CcdA